MRAPSKYNDFYAITSPQDFSHHKTNPHFDSFSLPDKSGAKGRIAGEDDVVNDYHTFFSAGDCFGEIGLLKNAPR